MRRFAGAALLVALAGCGGNTAAPAPRTFDLGIAAPGVKLPALRVTSLRAVAPFDGVQMVYRLAWRHPSELADYAHSRWAAPPAELIRKQLLRAAGEGPAKCGLEIELQEFTQVFASKEASEARIELRASLANSSARIATRGVTIVEPGAGPDAASGAESMARAVERVLGDLAAWVGAQPGCT
ncbi:MAG: membrane integrity-associated transporter subunit PqiC [Betaproteobacteria bacterium]|nr:membrane integrity-associated transporter subunit PqiC [Betaproteobacteria bacterium]